MHHNIPWRLSSEELHPKHHHVLRPGAHGIKSIDFRRIHLPADGPMVSTERVGAFAMPEKSFGFPAWVPLRSGMARSFSVQDYVDLKQFATRMR